MHKSGITALFLYVDYNKRGEMMNPVDEFVKQIKTVKGKGETFYTNCFEMIEETLGDRYEGGKLDTYLSDIKGHDYEPAKVKDFLIELVHTVDRTDRGGSNE